MFRHLLVPLDGSLLAEAVLPIVRLFGRRLDARVTLLHVVERHPPARVHGEPHLDDVREAEAYLAGVSERLRADGVEAGYHVHEVAEGDVARSIVHHAEAMEGDLILLTAHGRGGVRGLLVGRIAQQVIGSGSTPVLVAHPGGVPEAYECRRIAVPLDGAAHHEHSLPVARALGTAFGARVHLVTVVPRLEQLLSGQGAPGRFLPLTTEAQLDMQAQEAVAYLERVGTALRESGLQVSGQVRRGDPVGELVQCFRDWGADLAVVATHALKGWAAFWEGSVTPRLLSQWRGPTLLVRAG